MEHDRILIVDDEETIQTVLVTLLHQEGYDVQAVGSGDAAIACLSGAPFGLVLLDIVLPGMNGLTVLERIKQRDADTQVVMMTSHSSAQTAIEALRHGAYDYIHKPFELGEVVALVARALEKHRLVLQNRELVNEQRRQNEELSDAVRRLKSLNAAGIGLSGIASLREMLDFFVELVAEELDAARVSLMLVNREGTALTIAAARGLPEEIVKGTIVPLGEGISGRVAREGRMLFSDSEDGGGEVSGHPGAIGPYLSLPICVSVPIRTPRDILGVLNATSRLHGSPFSTDDAAYLSALAGQLAVAIERAKQADRLLEAYDALRSTQDLLVASTRLRALGEMAAGVAHDFNNVLNGIVGRSQLIQRELAKPVPSLERTAELAKLVEKLAWQGAETIRRIQEFTRIRKDRPKERVKIGEVARLAVHLTEPKWREEVNANGNLITVDVEQDDALEVVGSQQELAQAISNLIFNATEAMPRGGRIQIRTKRDGREVRLSVSDTGQGMSPETRQRLFEPFFSTKQSGQGLGLSVVFGIATRMGGRVEVDSRLGEGTRVTLVLPLAEEVTQPTAESWQAASGNASTRRGRLLVVDDEEMNRTLCRDVLAPAGHEVCTAACGEDALKLVAEQPFDLVITDLGMPGLTGYEVALGVKQKAPGTRVVLLSGWGVQQDEARVREAGIDCVLSKPVAVDELLDSVRQLLPP